MEQYELEKWIWTEADFDVMGWHDATVHALAFIPEKFELLLDIDYILKWVHPREGETYFKFWVAPATLVFENVYDLKIELEPLAGIELQDIRRTDPKTPVNSEFIGRDQEWRWTIEAHEGEMTFGAIGFNQYFRRAPSFGGVQDLPLDARGGFSFDRSTGQER